MRNRQRKRDDNDPGRQRLAIPDRYSLAEASEVRYAGRAGEPDARAFA